MGAGVGIHSDARVLGIQQELGDQERGGDILKLGTNDGGGHQRWPVVGPGDGNRQRGGCAQTDRVGDRVGESLGEAAARNQRLHRVQVAVQRVGKVAVGTEHQVAVVAELGHAEGSARQGRDGFGLGGTGVGRVRVGVVGQHVAGGRGAILGEGGRIGDPDRSVVYRCKRDSL